MTPGARVAAAIGIIDQIKSGVAAEKALTAWARASRFAGSKDRAAVRDHVFDVLRAKRSLGDGDGRSLMMRLLVRDDHDLDAYFHGQGHAPSPLTAEERMASKAPLQLSEAAAHDLPDWLWPLWVESLGDAAKEAALTLQTRADVFLRVNMRRASVAQVTSALAAEDIAVAPHEDIKGCLRVTQNARRVKASTPFADGLVELQDAASQFAVQAVPVEQGARVLDYCAGGGGKALAFADLHDAAVFAHDIAPKRMADLPVRAARAKVDVTCVATADLPRQAPFDVVFCDAPCSGSGTWRRTPDAKWQLTPDRLATLQKMQAQVLDQAAPLVAPGGRLIYATCSVLRAENEAVIARFVDKSRDWQIDTQFRLLPGSSGDGFFLCNMVQK
ncbi:MAG: RsmB/NOP family class I SAM-dependent RNA methyltransferase [Pseudomonadota bacterium]